MIDRSLNYGRHIIRDYLIREDFASILDVGAGEGSDLLIAKGAKPNAKLYAIECYPESVQKLEERDIEVTSLNIETEKLPFSDESLDVIMGNQIFEHVKEVYWIFHEISRVLKVGGKLIIGVPNLASLHNRLLLSLGKQPTSIKTNSAHVRGYTKGDILTFLDSGFPGGYKLKRFKGSNFYPFPSFVARPMAVLLPSMAWSIFLLMEKTKEYDNSGFIEYPIKEGLQTNFFVGP